MPLALQEHNKCCWQAPVASVAEGTAAELAICHVSRPQTGLLRPPPLSVVWLAIPAWQYRAVQQLTLSSFLDGSHSNYTASAQRVAVRLMADSMPSNT